MLRRRRSESYPRYGGTAVREFLLQARDGSMWFRSGNDVLRFGTDGSTASLPGGVMAREARDGSVWIAGPTRLLRYDRGAISEVAASDGLSPQMDRHTAVARPSGHVRGFAAGRPRDGDGYGRRIASADPIRTRPDGGRQAEHARVCSGGSRTCRRRLKVQSLFVDREGNRWVGTLGRGLLSFRRAPLIAYTKENGLSDSPFRTVFQDREGRIWVGGDDSLYWFDGRRFHLLPGLSDITTIAQTPDGDLWFGGSGALHRWRSGVLTRYPLDTPSINQLLVDRDGTLWVDAPGRTVLRDLYRFRDGNFEKVDTDVMQIAEDVDGGLWLALEQAQTYPLLRAGKTVDYGARKECRRAACRDAARSGAGRSGFRRPAVCTGCAMASLRALRPGTA